MTIRMKLSFIHLLITLFCVASSNSRGGGGVCAQEQSNSTAVTARDCQTNVTYVGYVSDGVENFQGIRYGQDTSGANRFKHPKAFEYPTGTTVQATAAGASCPQNTIESFIGLSENPGVQGLSEDCLNLRIARPSGTKAGDRLPMLVWIYGGGDETGSTNYTLYDPTYLVLGAAAKGTPVIYVAMNYRLNVFGFANSPALRKEHSLNSGLLDQRLALEWIAKNIEIFGGDPEEVTLFGQSDGAVGVGLQLTSYGGKCKPYFKRGIMESGAPSADIGTTGNFTVNSTTTVAELAGCPDSGNNSSEVLECLREVPMTKLLNAVLQYENITSNETSQDIFYPAVDGDFLPEAPSKLLEQGRFHKNVSIITGWTFNDGTLFTTSTLNSSQEVEAFVKLSYPGLKSSTITLITSLYPLSDFVEDAQTQNCSAYFLQAAQIYRDLNFACPTIAAAKWVSHYGADSYLYEFNTSSFAPLLALLNASYYGVLHVSDVPFAFNNANLGLGLTAAQNITQSQVSGSWAHFATTGDPSGGANSNTNNTLTGWKPAFPPGFSVPHSGVINETRVRVIGGPFDGNAVLTASPNGTDELDPKVLGRCNKLWVPDIIAQLQV